VTREKTVLITLTSGGGGAVELAGEVGALLDGQALNKIVKNRTDPILATQAVCARARPLSCLANMQKLSLKGLKLMESCRAQDYIVSNQYSKCQALKGSCSIDFGA
jgi:predicted aconitase with swiveling domain